MYSHHILFLTQLRFPFICLLSLIPVFGLGFSYLYYHIITRYRISEYFRLLWLYCWNVDERKDLSPFRIPTSVTTLTTPSSSTATTASIPSLTNDGSVRLLLSPHTAITPSLHVTLLTIQPGQEIPSHRARAVEFYYVVSGSGSYSQQGVVDTYRLQSKDCFVVEYGHLRWIANGVSNRENLILLRVTDGGLEYCPDRIRSDPNIRTSTCSSTCTAARNMITTTATTTQKLWRNGLMNRMQDKVRDYYNRTQSNGNAETNGIRQ